MKAISSNTAYRELGKGRVLWSVQERNRFRDNAGIWLEPDFSVEHLASGWRIFGHAPVGVAIQQAQGRVRIVPDRLRPGKFIELNTGLALDVTRHKTHINIWREVPAWGAGSGFSITVGPRGMKMLLKFTKAALIPDLVQFGLSATGLDISGRRVMDGGRQAFRMPDLFAYASSDPDRHIDVPESLSGGVVTIDLAAVKPRFAGTSGPWYVDPSFEITPTTADTVIAQSTPTANYGSSIGFSCGHGNGSNNLVRDLGRFDLSSVEGTVSTVDLQLYYYAFFATNPTAYTFRPVVSQLLRAFVEAQATWNNWASGSPWSTAGAGSDGSDYSSTYSSLCDSVITTFGWYHWTDANIIAQVQAAVGGNWDWLLTRDAIPEDTDIKSSLGWYASEYTNPALRPAVDIVTAEAVGVVPGILPPWLGGEFIQ